MPKGNRYDAEHLRNISSYQRQIDEIFKRAAEEAARIAESSGAEHDPDKVFSFDDYPSVRKRVDKMTSDLSSRMERTIVNGIKAQWDLSNRKNDDLVETVTGLKADDFPSDQRKRYFGTNESARRAFLDRREKGLSLSDKVWKQSERFRKDMELGIDVSLGEGMSADELGRRLRGYLNHPETLFSRVRDERGNLVLSKNAAVFHPGRGVYRSSYMNARRLAATETNMAYRSADYERWKDLDFVVGIEIQTSNNHTTKTSAGKTVELEDICDTLAGRYPKGFKFVGWHPHCRCIATTILKTEEEMEADTERMLNGEEPLPPDTSRNYIGELPKNFTGWLDTNSERIENAKSLPYFLKDNQKLIEEGGANATATDTMTPTDREIQALQPQINEVRRLAQEWGISTNWIDSAVAAKDLSEINEAMATIRNDVNRRERTLQTYIDSATKAIAEAQARGADFSAVSADLSAVTANKSLWSANSGAYNQRVADLNSTPGTGTGAVTLKSTYSDNKEVNDLFKEVNKNEKWFQHGDLDLQETTRAGVNGDTNMMGRIRLKPGRLNDVKSALGKIGAGKADTITEGEADAMATFWHEITHNRNIPGAINLSKVQERYMELANEYVARHSLPEFYNALGVKDTPHTEFMTNRFSTGYNGMVTNYDHVIKTLGLDSDKVYSGVRNHLFSGSYKEQATGLKQGLIDGGIKYIDTSKKAVEINNKDLTSLVKIISEKDGDYDYYYEGDFKTPLTKEQYIDKWLEEHGFIKKKVSQ